MVVRGVGNERWSNYTRELFRQNFPVRFLCEILRIVKGKYGLCPFKSHPFSYSFQALLISLILSLSTSWFIGETCCRRQSGPFCHIRNSTVLLICSMRSSRHTLPSRVLKKWLFNYEVWLLNDETVITSICELYELLNYSIRNKYVIATPRIHTHTHRPLSYITS